MNDLPPTVTLNFRSDNVGTASPEILRAVEAANRDPAASYGDDDYSAAVNQAFSTLFETPVTVFPVATGTAANAISLSCCARPWGAIYCHQEAHVHTSEGGATEFYSGGAKLVALPGEAYKLAPATLQDTLATAERGIRNRSQPDAVTITQATEYGTVYRREDIAAIGAIARDAGIRFHMDGARFANALARLDCTPAEMTWRAGVDILSFGVTKNGGMNADAIVVFNAELAEPLSYRLRRAGQTWSKMRFSSAQLLAYVQDDLYLRLARHSNAIATRLGRELGALPGIELVAPVEANMLFLRMPDRAVQAITAAGARFGRRRGGVIRLVTRFDMDEAEATTLVDIVRRALD
ncbi:threonine aldolase family protein [Bordetella sp. H567]|uniref:threonine aldolase family protein n=1 Tax=Bordetella sp. H567 TaxID=1697043 RepID=UPI0009F6FA4F|nr:beta-eliminating lyase-related protein [Bordetella sp. H567]